MKISKSILAVGAAALAAAAMAFAPALAQVYNVLNYSAQGGALWNVGGAFNVLSGGVMDVKSGGTLKIAGTTVSATAAELNANAGATAGTVVASKAAVVDASSNITGFHNVGLNGLLAFGSGGSVTADKSTLTANVGNSYAVTGNTMAGVLTTDSLTTAAAGSQAITITDSQVTTASAILVTRSGGTNSAGTPIIKAVPGTGSFVLTVENKHASSAFNGTFVFSYLIL